MKKTKLFLLLIAMLFAISLTACGGGDGGGGGGSSDSGGGGGGGNTTATDIDGNVYNTVTIGAQVWMKENLKTTKYRNGDAIGTTSPATLDISGETSPKYQWAYDGNESNAAVYGRLYTWYAATDSRGLCPTGWHVPTDAEWTTLTDYLGGEAVAGGKIKEAGTAHWNSPNTGADNSSGFTALPGGVRFISGKFANVGYDGFWWSATEDSAATAWLRNLNYTFNNAVLSYDRKSFGFSVRCVKDSDATVTDIDGNVYNTVTIGAQVWMKENLKVTKYRNGDAIPTTTADISGETSPKYQWAYDNSESNVATYGRLYTGYAANDSRGLCPTGWHLPTDAEWTTLTDYLGGEAVAGGKIKEAGTAHWNSPNTGADNSSGFTALPGGFRYLDDYFANVGYNGDWWSDSEGNDTFAWYRYLFSFEGKAHRDYTYMESGFSVRCVRD